MLKKDRAAVNLWSLFFGSFLEFWRVIPNHHTNGMQMSTNYPFLPAQIPIVYVMTGNDDVYPKTLK